MIIDRHKARARVRKWTGVESGVELLANTQKSDLCGYALTDDAERIAALWNLARGFTNEQLLSGQVSLVIGGEK